MQRVRAKSVAFFGLIIAGCVGLTACASSRPKATLQTQVEQETVVTVEAIDVPDRLVTVRTTTGDALTFYIDESVKDFPQAKVGDRVRIRYRESYAFRLKERGESGPGAEVTTETSRDGGAHPQRTAKAEVKATVRIETVSADGKSVTFTGPRGRRATQILDPALQEYVRKLRAGDEVEVTYQEALALSLDRV